MRPALQQLTVSEFKIRVERAVKTLRNHDERPCGQPDFSGTVAL